MASLNAITLKCNSLVLNAAGKYSSKYLMLSYFLHFFLTKAQWKKKKSFPSFLQQLNYIVLWMQYQKAITRTADLEHIQLSFCLMLKSFCRCHYAFSDAESPSAWPGNTDPMFCLSGLTVNILVVTLPLRGIVLGFITSFLPLASITRDFILCPDKFYQEHPVTALTVL